MAVCREGRDRGEHVRRNAPPVHRRQPGFRIAVGLFRVGLLQPGQEGAQAEPWSRLRGDFEHGTADCVRRIFGLGVSKAQDPGGGSCGLAARV